MESKELMKLTKKQLVEMLMEQNQKEKNECCLAMPKIDYEREYWKLVDDRDKFNSLSIVNAKKDLEIERLHIQIDDLLKEMIEERERMMSIQTELEKQIKGREENGK